MSMAHKKQRNLLFLLVDCLRADMCFGEGRTAKTPTIDSLCRNGTVFLNAISSTSTTTPSVASILTALYPSVHGIRALGPSGSYQLNPNCTTLAEVLKKNGYNTYAEVTGTLLPEYGLDKGFDEYHFREVDEKYSPINDVYSPWGKSLIKRFEGKEFKEPWFVFIHFWELHFPRWIRKDFDAKGFGRNRYERALSSLDAYMGELLKYVNSNTVIVFHSDHGERLFETQFENFKREFLLFLLKFPRGSGLRRKLGYGSERIRQLVGRHGSHVLDIMVRVPLVFIGKGLFKQNKTIQHQVRQIDIFPTIVEALGLDCKNMVVHGRSLLPLINDQEILELPAFCEAVGIPLGGKKNWLVGIRTSQYKFIFSPYNERIPEELYDLRIDPYEKRNIVKKEPETARKLRRKIEDEYLTLTTSVKETKLSAKEDEKIMLTLKKLGYL